MKVTIAALLLAALPLALPAAAQETQAMRQPVLTVTGEGRVDTAPDMAVISLGVTTDGDTAAEALKANSEAQAEVLAALEAAGVAARDVQTSGLSLSPLWDGRPQPDGRQRIVGYQASNMVTIRARDLDKLGGLLDTVVTTGANQLNGLSFGLSEPRPAEDQARQRAVEDARAKAQLYASALGVELGPVLELSESAAYQPPQPMYRQAMDAAVPVAQGEIQVTATVTVTFAMN